MLCVVHNHLFKVGDRCEFCVSSMSLSPQEIQKNPIRQGSHPPSLPVETKKSKKGVQNLPPYGKGLTERQLKALEMREKGLSYSAIATSLNVSKGTVQDLLSRAYGNAKKYSLTVKRTPLTIAEIRGHTFPMEKLNIRLHNDEFKIKVESDYKNINCVIKNLGRNLEYKIIPYENCKIKLHKNNTLTVRFLKDICAVSEIDCKRLADERIKRFCAEFNMFNIKLLNNNLINRHYGLLGSSFAKKVIDERKEIIIRDDDNKVRLRIDKSVIPAEIDAEHINKGLSDVGITRAYFEDLINKPHYTPSMSKEILDTILKVQHEYAIQIKKHLLVQDETLKTLKAIQESLKK